MASPQTENGFTKISNELLEAMCMVQLSGNEWSIVHTVIRKTYGYNKKDDWIAISQLCESTGLIKQRVNEAKQKLLAKRILIQKGKKLSLNKNYDTWIKSNGKALRSNGKALLKVTEKREYKRKKETGTKEIIEQGSNELKNNKKDMSFKNQRKYREDGHWEEPAVDAESGEAVPDELEVEKAEERELNEKIRHNLKLVEEIRGLPFGTGKDMAYHVKIYREMLKAGWSHQTLIDSFIELINSDHWKAQKAMGQYPGMNTVQFTLRNKKPS